MKYLYTLIILFITSTAFAQIVADGDFESGTANTGSWAGNAYNPVTYGEAPNTNTVQESNNTAGPNSYEVTVWQNITVTAGEAYLLTFTANTAPETTGRKLRAGIGKNGGDYFTQWVDVILTETAQTFTLSFGVPNDAATSPNRVVFEMGHDAGYIAIDDVSIVVDTTAPTAGPAAPTHDAADVISIFSDTYTTSTGLANVTWDGASESEIVDIAGNNALKVKMQNFLGTQLPSKTDLSGMTHMHYDIWIANGYQDGAVFKTKLSDHNKADGTDGESSSLLHTYEVTATDSQTWVSVDVSLSDDFSGSSPLENVLQILFDPARYLGLVYIDNLYFYNDGSAGGGGETPTTTTYCDTEVTHFNIAGHANPLILTVENSGADSMTVTGSCPVNTIDVLIVNSVSGGGTASAATITNGVATIDLTWPAGTMPATTTFEVLWSDDQFAGNNMVKAGTGNDALGNIDTTNVCPTASVKDISFYNIDVYPNPVSNVINVRSEFTIDNLSVLDLTGRTVKQQISNNKEFSLDVSELAKGIYLVKLTSGEKQAVTKFIKK
ncbi:MAG TPA: hypothetical protein DCF89_02215 [Flavobacteriales bacterium]|nr:hypothetical protein [Flavobacteriales bacterium]